jgi:putative membrane protein
MDIQISPESGPGELLPEKDKKAVKKEKREFKDQLAMERTELAMDRTLLAMVRTATTFMTFGFAIWKLMKEQARKPGDHPLMELFSPKFVALVLLITGLVGLVTGMYRYVTALKRVHMYRHGIYRSPSMLLSYTILFMLVMLIAAAVIGA